MGSALRRLVVEYKGKFLSDSKKISGTGRHTKKVIDKLQNYYGMAIRSNVGDLRGMMMAVQATLHHMTSTDDRLVHHMCPEGGNSWCSYNKAKVGNKLDEYKHGFDPIPHAIVQLLKPIIHIIDWVVDSFCLYACSDTLRMQTNLCTPQSVEILSQTPVFFWT